MIDHAIFDLDGTLVDSVVICCDILDDMLRDRGQAKRVCRIKARDFVSHGGTVMVAGLLEEACGDPVAEIAEFRTRYSERDTPPESLFNDVRDGLQMLRANGYVLAVCSNKPQNLCDKVVADLDLADLFAVVTGRQGSLRPKPASDLMDVTLARLRVGAERCVFVGDSELDHDLAAACNMSFLFVTYGYSKLVWTSSAVRQHDMFHGVVEDILSNATIAVPAPPRRRYIA